MAQSPEWIGETVDPTAVDLLSELLDALVRHGIPRVEARDRDGAIHPDDMPENGCYWCYDPEWEGESPPCLSIHLHFIWGLSTEVGPDGRLGHCTIWLLEHDEAVGHLRYWPGLMALNHLLGPLADCWWDRNKGKAKGLPPE